PVQQIEYRNLYTLMLSFTPMMAGRVDGVRKVVAQNIQQVINASGAHMSSPHYIEASMGPLLSTMQQLKMNAGIDLFRSDSRMAAFGAFYMDLLTPPEPRFGGVRKLI